MNDTLFVHCGGKDRTPLAVKALRAIGVKASAIVDFDILSAVRPLSDLVAALGGNWAEIEERWKRVHQSVDKFKAEIKTAEVRVAIEALLAGVTEAYLPRAVGRQIEETVMRGSTWWLAKMHGVAHVPAGAARQACDELLRILGKIGLHVVPVGELERFDQTSQGHGPEWVNSVLQKDLMNAPELAGARDFIKETLLSL